MELIGAQVCGMVALGLGTMIIGLLPSLLSSHRQQWPLLLSLVLCFGGGVLFSTSVIHILPELREVTRNAELLLCTGFFSLYFIDELVHLLWSTGGRHNHHDQRPHSHIRFDEVHEQQGHSRSQSSTFPRSSGEAAPLLGSESNLHGRQLYNPNIGRAYSHNDLCHDHKHISHMCHTSDAEPCNEPPIGHLGLLVALSVHAILEGLAIGLENSVAKVWLLVGAVASHKLVVGFCLGAELASNATSTFCKHFVAILVFSVGSVVGISVGMVATDMSHNWSGMVQPILQGLAAGTLLYVTVCEVLPRERAKWHNRAQYRVGSLAQYLSMLTGFVIMTLITRYLDIDNTAP